MDINETIHDRIGELVKEFGEGKNTVFASKLGVSEGNIRGYIKGIVPKHDILEKIVKCFDINAEWLLTGIGEMKRKEVRPFPNETNTHSIEDKLLSIIQEKDATIREQAEEIGRLRERGLQLERMLEKNVSGAATSTTANVG